jgi:GTP 3',8-cyclase
VSRALTDSLRDPRFPAFDPWRTSTARRTVRFDLWGREVEVYANANLSILSGQACPGSCGFCVARLRPASRGPAVTVPPAEKDDERYFARLEAALDALAPLDHSVSITGGEPTVDPRLPRLLELLACRGVRKRTMTSNGVGLLEECDGRRVLDWVTATGIAHLNLSRAHPEDATNAAIMGVPGQLTADQLGAVAAACRASGTRMRLSCVLLRNAVADLDGMRSYLAWAERLGVDNVVFRQLMLPDRHSASTDPVIAFSDHARVELAPLFEELDAAGDFAFQQQVVGYYYQVEVWRWRGVDVVLERADLGALATARQRWPGLVFELVFHPDSTLASTWQGWDGGLGPPTVGG